MYVDWIYLYEQDISISKGNLWFLPCQLNTLKKSKFTQLKKLRLFFKIFIFFQFHAQLHLKMSNNCTNVCSSPAFIHYFWRVFLCNTDLKNISKKLIFFFTIREFLPKFNFSNFPKQLLCNYFFFLIQGIYLEKLQYLHEYINFSWNKIFPQKSAPPPPLLNPPLASGCWQIFLKTFVNKEFNHPG